MATLSAGLRLREDDRRVRLWAVPLVLALVLAVAGVAMAHDLEMPATISPPDGSAITAATTALSGTFGELDDGDSGCGLGGTIGVVPSAGTVVINSTECENGVHSWTATWSDYGEGTHTITASFVTNHGGNDGLRFEHEGGVVAEYTYTVVASGDCEPDGIHGQYVSCVARSTESKPGKGQVVSAAAKDK